MSLIEFIQLVLRNKKWVILFPLLTGTLVFVLTQEMPRTYSSEMVIYTGLASGYNVDNDIAGKIDYHEANSKFDNLINTLTSRETKKDVSLQLLAYMIHNQGQLKRLIKKLSLDKLEWLTHPQDLKEVSGFNSEETYTQLSNQLSLGGSNKYYQIVYGQYSSPFNIRSLDNIKATRLGFSDMVKVEYTAEDAFTTKKTLDILSAVFLHKYKGMRVGEVSSVVKYFEEQTALAFSRLQTAELALKSFRTTNRVINYYEQTKYIADQKEDIEQRESQLEMDLKGYQSALNKVEKKLNSRVLVKLQSEDILNVRNELSNQFHALELSRIRNHSEGKQNPPEIDVLKKNLKGSIDGLYELNNSTEGIPGKELLDQWLNLTVNVEESQARLTTLYKNKSEFDKVYDHFAPMGSDLNKLERDVDVAEKEYLNLLHNLNQAKLRERNLVVTENISITDPPDMPVVPNSSKRLLLLISAVLGCGILVLVILLLNEYLDDSISDPIRFQEKTGIPSASAFVSETQNKKMLSDVNAISYNRWMLSLCGLAQKSSAKPVHVLAVPLHQTTYNYASMIETVINKMNQGIYTWSFNSPSDKTNTSSNTIRLSDTSNKELLNPDVLAECNQICLFINAAMKLDTYHTQLIERWKELNLPIHAVIVNTPLHQLEKFLGEIPKHRSTLRRMIKERIKRYSK